MENKEEPNGSNSDIPVIAPVVSTASEPVVASAPEPVVSTAPEHVVASAPEPVVSTAPEPVVSTAPEHVVASAPEPVVTTASEPVVASAPEPVVASAPEPVVASAPESVVASAPEPVVQSAPESVVAPEPEPEPSIDAEVMSHLSTQSTQQSVGSLPYSRASSNSSVRSSSINSVNSVTSMHSMKSNLIAPPPSLASPLTSFSSSMPKTVQEIASQYPGSGIGIHTTVGQHSIENDASSAVTTMSSSLATSLANSKEYKKFHNQLQSLRRNNKFILKECKDSKRLLDLKYQRLTKKINYIQISVIFLSTLSGFMQGTKEHFGTSPTAVTVSGITISTYISLVLSIAKYYKFDENKEKITNLREKYAALHNKLEFRMDVLGPWMNKSLWEHQDHAIKYKEWSEIVSSMNEEYKEIIATKQLLCTEFEIIMDSTSRNKYHIKNKNLEYFNRSNLFGALKKEYDLEQKINKTPEILKFTNSIRLPDDELDNWDEDDFDV